MNNCGIIFNIQRFSIHDGPGIRTTIFMKGCPMRCWWCHNPEGINPNPELMWNKKKCIKCKLCISACKHKALEMKGEKLQINKAVCVTCGNCTVACPTAALKLVGRWVSSDELIKEILKDVMYYDASGGGVTFSGGEPLLQINFLMRILPILKNYRIHVAIDTSGYILSFQIEKLLPYVDLFLYDLKIVDRTKHVFNTGVSNDLIKTNLWFLLQKGKNVIIRIPIIPGFNDSEEDKIEFVSFLRDFKTFQIEINLLPYHDVSEKYEALWQTRKKPGRKYNEIVLNSLKKDLERLNFTVKIGG